jgi:hypothetical protein
MTSGSSMLAIHLELAAAAGAGVDLDAEHPLQALRPAHGYVARGEEFAGVGSRRLRRTSAGSPTSRTSGPIPRPRISLDT